MRFHIPIPLPRRQTAAAAADAEPQPRRGLRGCTLCCPLAHLLVVVANTLQLAMMVAFLSMLLVCLNGDVSISWFSVFSPLWLSDSITLVNSAHELRRVWRMQPEAFTSRRNALIAQVNRLKGSIGVATFKFLLAMRQDGYWPQMSVVLTCTPYFVAALLRLLLHLAKKPIPPVDGSSTRPMRPGTPFNPVHPIILMLACRADGMNSVSWTATFWPLWTVFGLLGVASIAATTLAVGILVARDPPDNGQRALFFLCYAFLLTVTTTGLTFLIALADRLDGNENISYALIVTPLIVGYSLLLLFYLVFTIFLPPLLLRDLNAAALAEEEAEVAEEEGGVSGVIEAVSQQLAPPVLVQQSSTLFRRMGNSAMFERFLPTPSFIAPYDSSAKTSTAAPPPAPTTELALTDLEATPPSPPHAKWILSGSIGGGEGAVPPSPGLEEYDALEKDIEDWVRTQQHVQQLNRIRKPRPTRGKAQTAPAAPDTLVPPEMKVKLRRLMSLKEQLAAAACAEACGPTYASAHDSKPRPLVVNGANAPPPLAGAGVGATAIAPAAEPSGGAARLAAQPEEAGVELSRCGSCSADGIAEEGEELVLTSANASPVMITPRASAKLRGGSAEAGGAEGGGGGSDSEGDGPTDGVGGGKLLIKSPSAEDDEDEDEDLCAICFTGPRDAVLLECGHGGICYACAKRCLRKKGRECPMCRAPVDQVVQIRLDGVPTSPQHTGVVRVQQAGLPDEIDLDN